MSKNWIGVDFDGTLAYSAAPGKLGKPVKAMLQRVKDTIKGGTEVRIFTVRAQTAAGIADVRKWLKLHGLDGLQITHSKDADMVDLWDDRARRVVKDRGEFCAGCAAQKFNAAAVQTDC